MTDPGTGTVDQLILDHLAAADLPSGAADLVLAAMADDEALDSLAQGGAPPVPQQRSHAEDDANEPAGAYLSRIEVKGFRGVGDVAALDIVPGPGLTIVTGRNGSGKSSFAEGAEFALTGDNRRWADLSPVWREGWRNLHSDGGRYVKVSLAIDGHRGGATVERHWADGANLEDGAAFLQRAGERRSSVAELGWQQPLELYRPFLSYSELGRLLSSRRIDMYNSLHRVLGLDRFVQVESRLKRVRRESNDVRRQAADALPALREALEAHPDPRAEQAQRLLAKTTVDLDQLNRLATRTDAARAGSDEALRVLAVLTLPDRDQVSIHLAELAAARDRLAAVEGTPAAQARMLAGLLADALAYHGHHPDRPCPVCGGRTLDAAWAEGAQAQVQELTGQAEEWDGAEQEVRRCWTRLRDLVPTTPRVLDEDTGDDEADPSAAQLAWREWDHLVRDAEADRPAADAMASFDRLASAAGQLREAATRALERRQQAWQPLAEHIADWVAAEHRSRVAADTHRAAHKAVQWLVSVGEHIRHERLSPLAEKATEIWTMLRQDSSVDLNGIRLAGAGNHRRVDLNVAVDDQPGAALAVMSQGELHALALSLFLPRATVPESPFRFIVIDDPVQSMDPAKVHGLAQVLHRVAADRQVIVFTHDDRLPAAIRHLGLPAHLHLVTRRERSQVSVELDAKGDPAERYLDDAWAVARDEQIDPGIRTKVTCTLVRDAIEARCHDVVIAREMRAGRRITEVEALLEQATRLKETIALALFGDAGRHGEVNGGLGRLHRHAPQVVTDVNRGSHGGQVTFAPTTLVEEAQRLVRKLGD